MLRGQARRRQQVEPPPGHRQLRAGPLMRGQRPAARTPGWRGPARARARARPTGFRNNRSTQPQRHRPRRSARAAPRQTIGPMRWRPWRCSRPVQPANSSTAGERSGTAIKVRRMGMSPDISARLSRKLRPRSATRALIRRRRTLDAAPILSVECFGEPRPDAYAQCWSLATTSSVASASEIFGGAY